MKKLNIEGSSSTFKKKPVIIIVVGMAGKVLFIWIMELIYILLVKHEHCQVVCCILCWRVELIELVLIWWLGSGKTTFLHRLVCHTMASNMRGYVLNLDPAVLTLPFGANIDIRDTVRYKEVMKQFNLGPNGGILTSLNLFATKFDEVKLDMIWFFLLNAWEEFFFRLFLKLTWSRESCL